MVYILIRPNMDAWDDLAQLNISLPRGSDYDPSK